jgi:hypothetical protein
MEWGTIIGVEAARSGETRMRLLPVPSTRCD